MTTKTNIMQTKLSKKVTKVVNAAYPAVGLHGPTTADDVKSALLVVSLVINLFILIAWLTIQVTTKYDLQVATILFTR